MLFSASPCFRGETDFCLWVILDKIGIEWQTKPVKILYPAGVGKNVFPRLRVSAVNKVG
jgi:hypothetical protein